MDKNLSHVALATRTTDPRLNQSLEKVCSKINAIIDFMATQEKGTQWTLEYIKEYGAFLASK